jgi:prefoldin alpha subunit
MSPESLGTKEKEFKNKYLQLQLLRQQMEALLEEKIILDNKLNELNGTISAIEKLGKLAKGQETWSTFGSGTFVKTNIADVENVIVNIGKGIFVKKTTTEAVEFLKNRMEEVIKAGKQLDSELAKLEQTITALEPEVQKLAEQIAKSKD